MNTIDQTVERRKIRSRLLKAGFQVRANDDGDLLIECDRYTVRCYFSDELQQWRMMPYEPRVNAIVRDVVSHAKPV